MTSAGSREPGIRGGLVGIGGTSASVQLVPAVAGLPSVATWCAIRVGECWPGGLALLGLPFGCAVGDQAGDGGVGLVEVPAASEVALEGPPLLVLGVGVLDADPF